MYTDPKFEIATTYESSIPCYGIYEIRQQLKEKQEKYIHDKYGFSYIIPADGWVTKCKQKGFNNFEGVLAQYPINAPEVGQLICVGVLGWDFKFVLYRITEVRRSLLGRHSIVYGEEIEEFSTTELI